jgi:chromosome partitioning protein
MDVRPCHVWRVCPGWGLMGQLFHPPSESDVTVRVESVSRTARVVARGIGFPLLRAGATTPLGWPGKDVDPRAGATEEQTDPEAETAAPIADERPDDDDVSRETRSRGAISEVSLESEVSRETQDTPEHALEGSTVTEQSVSRETSPDAGHDDLSAAADDALQQVNATAGDTPLARALAETNRRRDVLANRGYPKPLRTRVLTVANQKGGVGKTTTTVNVAAALAQNGLRVLVVDLDPQGNASTALGVPHQAEVPSIYDVLVDSKPIADVVQLCPDVEGLSCVPATIDLAGAEIELVALVAREMRLQRAIRAYLEGLSDDTRPDYVLIDCPPSLGLLTVNAFVGADEVFIPIQCEYYALEGLSQLLKNIELIRTHLNPRLHVSTILLTMYDGRTRLSAQVADEVRSHFGAQTLRTTVPRSVRISEAPSHGQTVITYDPLSTGALSYLEAASELADRGAPPPTD